MKDFSILKILFALEFLKEKRHLLKNIHFILQIKENITEEKQTEKINHVDKRVL